MLGYQMDSVINKPALSSNHAAFLDPSIGRYCLTLATKNSMRNAVGEQNAAILGRWGTLMMATALRRSGLPVSAFVIFLLLYGIKLPDENMTFVLNPSFINISLFRTIQNFYSCCSLEMTFLNLSLK